MSFLYPWVFFALIPLYFLYKKNKASESTQIKLLYFSLAFIFIALSRPVISNSLEDEKFDSQEYIIALDASYSMQADDIKPSRYEASKEIIKELIRSHPKDKFTLFAFTSNTLLISPPTTDGTISIMALDALNPNYILTKSTEIKQLFETVAKTQIQRKNLLIFSDGGDENDLSTLLKLCKMNTIVPTIIATATKDGTLLKKDGVVIKDQYSSLVISRINPILKDLALQSGGNYYELDATTLAKLSNDMANNNSKRASATTQVKSYKELYYFPLILSLLLFFTAITKLHQLSFLALLLLLPNPSHADLIDFYHFTHAKNDYAHKEYLRAAKEFEKATPSVQSYFNIATSYYKAGHYKKALEYFDKIQTPSKEIKQKIFYAMAGCAIHLQRYDRAEVYYEQALALGEDKDALYNLNLLHKLALKTGVNISDMLPPKSAQSKQNSSKKTGTTNDEKKEGGGKSNSNQQAGESSNGAGDAKKGEMQKTDQNSQKSSNTKQYQMGYKSYELINKGFTNEKSPW
jgi:Ca-activated chloride channel family protein